MKSFDSKSTVWQHPRVHREQMLLVLLILILSQSSSTNSRFRGPSFDASTCSNSNAHPPVFVHGYCPPQERASNSPRGPLSASTPVIPSIVHEPNQHIKVITTRIKARPAGTKLRLLLSSKFGIKILFFSFQLFCILISLNLCVFQAQLRIPLFLRCLLSTNTGNVSTFFWYLPLHLIPNLQIAKFQ